MADLTAGEKAETVLLTFALLAGIAMAFGCGVGFFYYLVWGIS